MTAAIPPSTIISREEKEKHVLELYYNQGKNMRDIAKEMKMSFTTIGDVIKRDKQQKAMGRERGRERESEKYIDDGYDVDDNGNGKAEQQQQ